MTVETTTARVTYTGAGTTGPFSVPFYFLEDDDLTVIKTTIADGTETTLVLTTDYTVSGAADEAGGSVTLTASLSSAYKLTIIRDPDLLQEADYPPNDKFPAATHERVVDKLTMIVQRLYDLVNRSFRLSDGDISGTTVQIPSVANRAGKYLGFAAVTGELTPMSGTVAETDAAIVSYTPAGSGAVERNARDKMRERPSPADYDTNDDYLAACLAQKTNELFAQDGAVIHRLSDRLFLGGAVDNDGSWPNVDKDWLTTYQNTLKKKLIVGVAASGITTSGSPIVTFTAGGITPPVGAVFVASRGIPAGTTVLSVDSTTQITLDTNATASTTGNTFYSTDGSTALSGTGNSASLFVLNNDSPSNAMPAVFGAHSSNFASAGTSCIGIAGFAVNDNTTLATSAWGGYFEAHRVNSTANGTRGIEINVSSWAGSEIAPNAFQQSNTATLQLGAGCGLDADGQTDIGAAIQIVGNPMKFKAGIVFLNDSLSGTDGMTGNGIALSMANGHTLNWYNASQQLVARILTYAGLTSAQKMELRFTSFGMQIVGDSTQTCALFANVASAVNYLTFSPAATGGRPYIAASGTDTDIDLQLAPKGAGAVRFGTWTSNADAAVNGYVTIKDAAGTSRKLATIA